MFFLKAHEGRNGWWRWLLTIVGTLALWFAGQIPLLLFVVAETRRLGLEGDAFLANGLPPGVDMNLSLLLALLPFAIAFAGFWFLVTRLHKRPLPSVMTGRARFDWRRTLLSAALWFAVLGLGTFAILPPAYHYQFDPAAFWPLFVIAIVLIPIQTTFEEVFFRGYLMQGLALLSKSKLVPLIVVTVLFVLAHFDNPEFKTDYVKGILSYLSVSLLFGLTAVLDDGLEVPIGIHAANNLFLALVMSPSGGSFNTPAIFTAPMAELMKQSPYGEIGAAIVMFGVLFYALNWRFSTLGEPAAPPRNEAPAVA